MRPLSEREQRAAALALLVAAAAAAVLLVILPIAAGFRDRADQRELLRATYARDERIIGELPSIIRASAGQRQDRARFRLPATSEAAATAALVERLSGAVSGVGGTLTGVENLAAPSGTVRARAAAKLDLPQLAALLERIENGSPLLAVDALAIDANDDPGESHPKSLDARIEVSAYYPAAPAR